MALVDRIADLAIRIGRVLASKIDATHPGVARAWVCFGVIDGDAEKLNACTIRETLARTSASTRLSSASSLSPKDCAV